MNIHTRSHFHTCINRKSTQSDRNIDEDKRRGSERRWTPLRTDSCFAGKLERKQRSLKEQQKKVKGHKVGQHNYEEEIKKDTRNIQREP